MPPGILSLYICIANTFVSYTLFIFTVSSTVNNSRKETGQNCQHPSVPVKAVNTNQYQSGVIIVFLSFLSFF